MIKKLAKNTINSLTGKMQYQRFFARLHRIALKGMNIGEGASLEKSGELYALKSVKSELQENKKAAYIIFDVGANIGEYSEAVCEVFSNVKTKIFSFEPSLKTFEKMSLNIGNKENVSLQNIAFGEKSGKHTLYSNKEGSGLASLYKRRLEHFNLAMNQVEEINIKTIDEFCEESGISHIHFLKMDVEGHELAVLAGAQKMLKSDSIDFIQFEFGGCNIDSRTFFQDFFYLLSPQYDLYRILKDGLLPIAKYDESYEVFMATNFLAKRKNFVN